MGNNFCGLSERQPQVMIQRLAYDMTPIKSKELSIIWLVGPSGSGRNTQAKLLAENIQFILINVDELITDESNNDTDRGMILREGLHNLNVKIPDTLVIDLIKEEMLRQCSNQCSNGYIINNFPRTPKQASLFIKEISDVSAIIYLKAHIPVLLQRIEQKMGSATSNEELQTKIIHNYVREIRESVGKYSDKLEKIQADVPVTEVYKQIETAINARIELKSRVITELDYSQPQETI